MSYKGRSLDPRQMTSRFTGTCYTCKKPIKKGEEIIYWPNGNHAEHFACGEADYRHSLASFEDEENYNNQYPSWWLKAVPVPNCRNRDYFLFVPHRKNAFSLLLHRQRKSLAKRKPDENGVLLKEKQPKAHAHYSKFSAKVTSWKYRVTKGGSLGHLILPLGEPPVGFIQIGKSIWPEPLFQNFHSGIV